MEDVTESPQINILISLSSRLLCEALQLVLKQSAWNCRAVLACDLKPGEGFQPDHILVDAGTLDHPSQASWGSAKVVLIDTGLAEEEIIKLLTTHKLYGVISTSTGTKMFRKALETVHSGQAWIEHDKIRALFHECSPATQPLNRVSLSRKEREIVLLIAEGRKNREIAGRLNISERTVKTHLSHIFKKANCTSRAQLAPLALKLSLHDHLPLPDPLACPHSLRAPSPAPPNA